MHHGTDINIPLDATEVDEAWVKSTLRKALGLSQTEGTVTVRQWKAEKAHEKGMLSSVFRITVQVEDEMHRLFLKIMPPDDEHRMLISSNFMDVTELETYRILFKDLTAFEKRQRQLMTKDSDNLDANISSILPRLYGGGSDKRPTRRAFFLLLADMSPEYRMVDFGVGLTPQQLTSALRDLAYFHATAYAMGQVEKIESFKSRYDFLSPSFANFSVDTGLKSFLENGMKRMEEDLMKDLGPGHIVDAVRRVRKDVGIKITNAVLTPGHERFLIHGDIWANNMLFDSSNRCQMIDWQFTASGSVFLDFGTLCYLSMPPSVTAEYHDRLIATYHERFVEVCHSLGVTELPWKNRMHFEREAKTEALFVTFLWVGVSYELVDPYPALKERVLWVLKESLKLTPEAFA